METTDPTTRPQCLAYQEDGGVGTMDLDPVTNHTETTHSCSFVTSGEKPQDDTKVLPPAPTVSTKYYSVMDDEGVDDVFIPPPPLAPSYMAPLLPAGGSTDATESNSSVTLANGDADATEAKANPDGLDWHHGEKQLMAAQNEVDEVTAGTAQTSKKSMDTVSLSNDPTPATDQDKTSMEGAGSVMDPSGRNHQDNTTGEDESNGEAEDVANLREGQETQRESDAERAKHPKQISSNIEENSENEIYFDKGNLTGKKELDESCGDSEDTLTTENVDCDGVETDASTPELSQCNQNKTQVPEIPTEVTNDNEEHVDTRSLNFNLTKCNWLRRESGASETQIPQLPSSESVSKEYVTKPLSPEMVRKEQLGDESWRIATEIQQGEQLLQRLQLVQQRQDVDMSESPSTSQQVVQERRGEESGVLGTEVDQLRERRGDLTSEDEEDEGAKKNPMEKEKNERNESKDVETKARMSSPTMPAQPEDHRIVSTEADNSDEAHNDSWVSGDERYPINTDETSSTQIPFPCQQQFSDTETSAEQQIHEAAQAKQKLQRAGGVFNLADDPDVLEIPFRTNISLEPLSTKVDPGLHSDWQFSEQKMQKEISQEIQRELVLVNQGKIPGEYSKGEVRQLQETKLLFEAFHQDNTEGPTRHRNPPTSLMKGHIYPTVLERTRSLEMVSLKSCPIFRAHSLRLYKSATTEREKTPENLSTKSPNGGSRDKTRLSPYPKQDKHLRLYRSMDSISTDDSTSAVETRHLTREGNSTQEYPNLTQNPFFKLRPALALQPEVEKDIREAREREEELRRQRCTLYGENRQNTEDEEKSPFTPTLIPGKSAYV